MSVYGMGSLFGATEEQLGNFVSEGFACIGWKKKEKPELYEILNSIKIGDIIYIKSLYKYSKSMKIKAIGIVTAEPKNTNTHNGYEECENEIGVKWIVYDLTKESVGKEPLAQIEINDQYLNVRKNAVFKEYDREIIEKIVKIMSVEILKNYTRRKMENKSN